MFTLPIARRARLSLLSAAVALLAGCAASGPPAPVVTRTVPPPVRPPSTPAPAPAPVAPAATTPAPPPAAPAESAAVQTAPVRSGAIEQRGVETRPTTPETRANELRGAPLGAPTPPPAAPAAPPALPANARTGPRGLKVPYSDAALAELRAAEAAAPAASAGAPASSAGAPAPSTGATAPSAATPTTPTAPTTPSPAAAPPSGAPVVAGADWAWPASGRVIQTFDQSSKGIALAGTPGDPVLAAADGRVIFSGNGPRGYGNLVIVKHPNDLLSVYAHNRSLAVKEGQSVKRGQKIAELGDSGASSPRLHFEIRQQGKPVDPVRILPRR
jgi:lipoprotein NlpD